MTKDYLYFLLSYKKNSTNSPVYLNVGREFISLIFPAWYISVKSLKLFILPHQYQVTVKFCIWVFNKK